MDINRLKDVLGEIIFSNNDVLTLEFTFDNTIGGFLKAYNNQLEVRIQLEWEYKFADGLVAITFKDKSNPINRIIGYLPELKSKFAKMESAYDVVGE